MIAIAIQHNSPFPCIVPKTLFKCIHLCTVTSSNISSLWRHQIHHHFDVIKCILNAGHQDTSALWGHTMYEHFDVIDYIPDRIHIHICKMIDNIHLVTSSSTYAFRGHQHISMLMSSNNLQWTSSNTSTLWRHQIRLHCYVINYIHIVTSSDTRTSWRHQMHVYCVEHNTVLSTKSCPL